MSHPEDYLDDCTPFYLLILRLMNESIDDLQATVEGMTARDAQLDAVLAGAHVNHRQRAIVQNALGDPAIPQKVEPHRRRYGVAYATARQDFLDLEALGLLECRQPNKAFEYYPTQKLLGLYAH